MRSRLRVRIGDRYVSLRVRVRVKVRDTVRVRDRVRLSIRIASSIPVGKFCDGAPNGQQSELPQG